MIQIRFTAEAKNQLAHEREHHPDRMVRRKMNVLWLKSCDMAHHAIGLLANVSDSTVTRYLMEYKDGGIEGLKHKHYRTPTSELNKYKEKIEADFTTCPPHTVSEAQARIEQLTGIKRSQTQIRNFLRRMGLKLRKTAIVPGKVDDDKIDEQRKFKEDKLDPRIKEAREQKRKLFFVDAAHFVHGAFLCFLWCFQRVFMRTPCGRSRFNVLGAFDVINQELTTVKNTTYINSESVCQLLKQIAQRRYSVPITLVLDNARYQRCRLVQDLAKELKIELLFLPSYSPNLNLIERLWKFVKKTVLYGKYYETFDKFKMAINECLNQTSTTYKKELQSLLSPKFQLFDKSSFLAA